MAAGILAAEVAISEAVPAALGVVSGTSEAPLATIVITGIILDLILAITVQVITVIVHMVIALTVIGLMVMDIGLMVTALITGLLFMAIHPITNDLFLRRQLYISNGKK